MLLSGLQSCRFQNKHTETRWSQDKSFVNRLQVKRIDFANDESSRPVRIVSTRQHSMPLFDALGRSRVHRSGLGVLDMYTHPKLQKWAMIEKKNIINI